MRGAGALIVAIALTFISGCGNGDPAPGIVLDGSPRYPSDQGVVTEISFERIVLDGERTYKVSEELKSFSTSTLKVEPMLGRDGQYVLIGTEGDTMTWMAGVAQVVPAPTPTVYYVGTLIRVDDERRLIFRDGTVLQLAGDHTPEVTAGPVTAEIDVATRRVRKLTATR